MERTTILLLAALVLFSCSTRRKVESMRRNEETASLMLSENDALPEIAPGKVFRDTLIVKDEKGEDLIIMKAVKDENGEMVASDVIDAAIVTARFRNVAERHGKVDLRFYVTVPSSMLDSRWQMRLVPEMTTDLESTRLDPVIITGKDYRRAQLRGYQQYERFVQSIVTDSTLFIRLHELEVFLARNIPQVYDLRNDTTFVSDEQFSSLYGVTERQAVDHYTNLLAVRRNQKKAGNLDRMWNKYVKVPIVTEGIRLDTVIQNAGGDFIYSYVQSVNVPPELKKVDISLSGSIFEQERKIYSIPESSPLTFYISSLSAFTDNTERYMTEVISRRVEANTACYIAFEQGKSEVREDLFDNAHEISRIKRNLAELLENEKFDIDSIIVTAAASPEGSYDANRLLTGRRSESVSVYFDRYMKSVRDSLEYARGLSLNIDGTYAANTKGNPEIKFIPRYIAEDWATLDALVKGDEDLTEEEKESYSSSAAVANPDEREKALSRMPYYQHLRESLYPRTRTVRFDFMLHRRGMLKDTIHTTVIDTAYMRGVRAIHDRDYQTAVTLLRPYMDYNAAVAFCCMDYNQSALSILERLEKSARVDYLLAILYSRTGDDTKAVQCYLDACGMDSSFIHRGNLDPEISVLIQRYNLNHDDEDYKQDI